MMTPNTQGGGSSNRTLIVVSLCIVLVTADWFWRTRAVEALVSLLCALATLLSLIVFKPQVDRVVAPLSLVIFLLVFALVRLDLNIFRPQSDIEWKNNPVLPEPGDYVGDINYTHLDYPLNGTNDWTYGVELSITEKQILLVEGYEAKFADLGTMGGESHCYLLITRGPLQGKIDLVASGLEVHNVASSAKTLEWAARKVADLKATYSGCAQKVDLWVGR